MKAKYPREGLTKNLFIKQPTKSQNIQDVKKPVTDPIIKKKLQFNELQKDF
jgi:hypothetical protein